MPSVKLKLKKSQLLKDGTHPIIVQVIRDSKKAIVTLGLTCELSGWSENNNLPKNRRLSLICQKKLLEIEELLFEAEDKGWSAKKIVNIFSGKDTKKLYFFKYVSEISIYSKQGVSTKNTDVYFLKKFSNYLEGKDIAFSNITFQLLREYKNKLEEEGVKTAYRYLSYLRQVYNYAVENDDFIPKSNPFKKILFNRRELDTTINRNLTEKQVIAIFNFKKISDPFCYKQQSLDFWKFCFLMRGINFIDLAMIKSVDVAGDYFNFTREKLKTKTNRKQKVKIHNEARKIIDKYIDKNREYIFPIFSNGQDKDKNKEDYNTYNYKRTTINENLKRIGKEIGSEFTLTSMSARYSFINLAKTKGVPFLYLQELIGHKTLTTTDIYLDIFPQEKIDDYHFMVIDSILNKKS